MTNPHLKPELSKSFTLGLVYEPFRDLSATLDVYYIKIDDQIISGGPTVTVRGNNLSPLPEYQPDGTTQLVTPPVAPIAYETISYATNTHIPYDWATYPAPNVWLPWNPSLHQQGAIGTFFTLGITYKF